jgi:hypothetical protein
VDTINWITMKGNLWETRARQGQIGKAGEWYGVQSSVFCLDVDDGNGMYVITENVCITNNTAGLKVGHIVDRMNFTNNVVVSTDDPRINGGYHTAALSTVPFQIGPQNSHNTMVYQRNIHVHLPLPRPLVAVPAAQVIPWKASNYCPNSPSFVAENPPPTFVDRNLYFSDDIAGVVVCLSDVERNYPNSTWKWTQVGGLDKHSVFNVDPLLDTSSIATDKRGIRVKEGSPALALGFRNFAYGPRLVPGPGHVSDGMVSRSSLSTN